jgi:hypothetical protein
MPDLADYITIIGTVVLLGSAIGCFLAVCVLRGYLAFRISIVDVRRFESYARAEAPPYYWVVRKWMLRLTLLTFAFTFLTVTFIALMVKFFVTPK